MDHAGLPLKTVLEQLDLLGGEVVPGAAQGAREEPPGRRAGRPDPRGLVAAKYGDRARGRRVPNANRGDNLDRRHAVPRTPSRPGPRSAPQRPGRAPEMTARRIAVVSAGLSNPSSTRLLADRLAERHRRARSARPRGIEAEVDVVRAARLRARHHEQPAHRLRRRPRSSR